MAQIVLEIVTPDGVKLSEPVDEVTAPSVEGEFGVLPGHIPLLAALKTGIVSYRKGGDVVRVAVGPGFAEVVNDTTLVLTERFITKAEIDPVRARLDLKEADEALDKWTGDSNTAEYAELVKKELWAAAQLELYGDPPPPTIRNVHEFQLVSRQSLVPGPDEGAPVAEASAYGEDKPRVSH
jgi:F-type H+-transporting ATPase subunit epsilon